MATVIVRDSARRDLVVCSEYFYEEGGNGLAMRFLNAAQESFVALTLMPRMGLPCGLGKRRFGVCVAGQSKDSRTG